MTKLIDINDFFLGSKARKYKANLVTGDFVKIINDKHPVSQAENKHAIVVSLDNSTYKALYHEPVSYELLIQYSTGKWRSISGFREDQLQLITDQTLIQSLKDDLHTII